MKEFDIIANNMLVNSIAIVKRRDPKQNIQLKEIWDELFDKFDTIF